VGLLKVGRTQSGQCGGRATVVCAMPHRHSGLDACFRRFDNPKLLGRRYHWPAASALPRPQQRSPGVHAPPTPQAIGGGGLPAAPVRGRGQRVHRGHRGRHVPGEEGGVLLLRKQPAWCWCRQRIHRSHRGRHVPGEEGGVLLLRKQPAWCWCRQRIHRGHRGRHVPGEQGGVLLLRKQPAWCWCRQRIHRGHRGCHVPGE